MNLSQAKNFVCASCTTLDEDGVKPIENLCDVVETMNEFCHLGDKLKTSGKCETAVTARMRLRWIKFRESNELLVRSEGRVHQHPVDIFFSLTFLESSINEVSEFVLFPSNFLSQRGQIRGFP